LKESREVGFHNINLLLMTAICFALPGCSASQAAAYQDRTVETGGKTYQYKVYVPADWTKDKKWPVILFLHGAGERGDDNTAQTRVGLGPALVRQAGLSAIVVLPQCSRGRWWPETDMQDLALAALNRSIAEFNGDPERIYLTGISMGGYGTWAIARKNPEKFAALAPVCGGVRPPPGIPVLSDSVSESDPYLAVAQKVAKTPVWVFHGDEDRTVPVSESRKIVEALKSIGGNVRYSEYAGVAHNSWDRAYGEPEFFLWLLSQHRSSPGK
jgi:predicted peptidase